MNHNVVTHHASQFCLFLTLSVSSQVTIKRDKRDDAHDQTTRYDSKKDNNVDIARFLTDGLDKAATKELSRKGMRCVVFVRMVLCVVLYCV